MSSKFFSTIIEEEKKRFGITNDRLKDAARAIISSHGKELLKKDSTHINYNNPEYRCAYLYRYASLHTAMIRKYFRKFVKKKEIRNHFKRGIKICSLGGGPGSDILGVFQALAVNPYFQYRIKQVSVLDICGGWCNTFENIISCLLKGNVKGVPETFINIKNFKHEYVEIDLLQSLPENVVEIISEADIICMVKFISVILAKERCLDALKVLGNLFKPGVTVIFIDNYQGNVFESIKDILSQIGLEIVLGPLHEVFINHGIQHNEDTYGCKAHTGTKISVVGLMKRDVKNLCEMFYPLSNVNYSGWDKQDFTITSVNVDDDDRNGDYTESSYNTCDKFVQTELEAFNHSFEDHMGCEMEELSALMKAIVDLIEVTEKVKLWK